MLCCREIHEGVILFGALANISESHCVASTSMALLQLCVHRSLHAVAGRLLKRAIRQDRPLSTCEALGICNKPGMPSSHAQITFYALTVFLLQLLRSQRFSKLSFLQCSKGFAYLAASLLVACSRVYLGYHTVAQVIAGAAAGSTMAFLWLAITRCAAPRFRGWQTSRLGQVFRLKDTWYLPDVLLFEYDNVLKAQHTKKTH